MKGAELILLWPRPHTMTTPLQKLRTDQKLLDEILGFGKELLRKLVLQFYYFLENQVLVSVVREKHEGGGGG